MIVRTDSSAPGFSMSSPGSVLPSRQELALHHEDGGRGGAL